MLAHGLGLEVHAGHGLDYASAVPIAALPQVMELNIGHFLIGEAVFEGFVVLFLLLRVVLVSGRAKARS